MWDTIYRIIGDEKKKKRASGNVHTTKVHSITGHQTVLQSMPSKCKE